jgi:hypothetical protein
MGDGHHFSPHARVSDGFYRSPADAFRAIDQSCVTVMMMTLRSVMIVVMMVMMVVLFVVVVVLTMMTMVIA